MADFKWAENKAAAAPNCFRFLARSEAAPSGSGYSVSIPLCSTVSVEMRRESSVKDCLLQQDCRTSAESMTWQFLAGVELDEVTAHSLFARLPQSLLFEQ